MKVLLVNGSSHTNGTTMAALNEMIKVFQAENVETEVIQLGQAHCGLPPVRLLLYPRRLRHEGRRSQRLCEKGGAGRRLRFCFTTYFAHPSGRLFSFLDRVFFSAATGEVCKAFQFKPGAAVAVARRGGTSATLDAINKYFGIAQMPVAGSTYWNMVHGLEAKDTAEDLEGLQTMRNLARNMVWMMRCFALGREKGIPLPATESEAFTCFVR